MIKLLKLFRASDEGSVFLAVIGLMVFVLLASTALMSTVVQGLGTTTASRADLQSQAAAEAGIARVEAIVLQNKCAITGGPTFTGTNPTYTAKVYTRASATAAWSASPSCPSSVAGEAKIVSSGSASANGLAHQRSGNVSVTSAEFSAPATPTTIPTTGPAVYAYSQQSIGGGGHIIYTGTPLPNLTINNGVLDCSGGASITANIIIGTGSLTLSGSCNVTGNIFVPNGTFAITNNTSLAIHGNIVAKAVALNTSGTITGSVWATQRADLTGWSGTITGDLTAPIISETAGMNVAGTSTATTSATYSGWYTLTGSLKTSSFSSTGGPTPRFSGTMQTSGTVIAPPAPATPPVPPWTDFAYNASDWTGFVPKTVSTCDYATVQAAIASLGSSNGLIDMRSCTGSISISNYQTITLNSDVALIGNNFAIGGSLGFASSTAHRLWFITPDSNPNGIPTCPSGGAFSITGGPVISANLSVMVYTPCTFTMSSISSGFTWRGQIYAATVNIPTSGSVTYTPMGLPGVNLDTGLAVGPAAATKWTLDRIRDVSSATPN